MVVSFTVEVLPLVTGHDVEVVDTELFGVLYVGIQHLVRFELEVAARAAVEVCLGRFVRQVEGLFTFRHIDTDIGVNVHIGEEVQTIVGLDVTDEVPCVGCLVVLVEESNGVFVGLGVVVGTIVYSPLEVAAECVVGVTVDRLCGVV